MSWLVVGLGAAAAAAGLLIPAWKLWKRRRYDDAVLEYRIYRCNRDTSTPLRRDEYRFWDQMARDSAARARGLYPLRADQDLGRIINESGE